MRKLLQNTLLGIAAAFTLSVTACSKAPTKVGDEDMTMGPANAKITVIEYASVTCAHCAEFNKDVMPQLMSKYIAPGKVRYVYREFLTEPQNVSAAGILVARCAGKDNYFKVIDSIMRAQGEMFGDGTGKNASAVLLRIAKSYGMTEAQFNTCVTDTKSLLRIQNNLEKYLKEDGIVGTPTFFVNGKRLTRTTGDIGDFDRAFQPILDAK